MGSLDIDIRDNKAFLRFSGEITLDVASAMKQEVEQATATAEYATLLVDLSEVTFIDSSGIGFLVVLKTRASSQGKDMYVTGLSQEIRKTFELVQLISFFQIVESEDDLLL